MKIILPSNKIYIKESKIPGAGRGVYASCDIKKGELIEKCPVIEISPEDESNLKESILITYFYYFGRNKESIAVALGFGSIYNHTYTPNAKYQIKHTENVINFITLKDIKKNEEITVNYKGENSKNNKPLWFEANY